jgi:hypothetical protein
MPSAMLDPQIAVEKISKSDISEEEKKKQIDAIATRDVVEHVIRAILIRMFPSLGRRL